MFTFCACYVHTDREDDRNNEHIIDKHVRHYWVLSSLHWLYTNDEQITPLEVRQLIEYIVTYFNLIF